MTDEHLLFFFPPIPTMEKVPMSSKEKENGRLEPRPDHPWGGYSAHSVNGKASKNSFLNQKDLAVTAIAIGIVLPSVALYF